MVNPFDKPAEMQLMDTYVPLPFEEYMRAGQNMQNRLDAVKADTLKWEADNLGDKKILNRDVQDYSDLRKSFVSELNSVMQSPSYLMSPEGQRKVLDIKERWMSNPNLKAMLTAYEVQPKWAENLQEQSKQNKDYNVDAYKQLENMWAQYGTPKFQSILSDSYSRKLLKNQGIDLDRMGIYDLESMLSSTPDSYVDILSKYQNIATQVKASGWKRDDLVDENTMSVKRGHEGVAMKSLMDAYGIMSDESGKPLVDENGDYIIDYNVFNLFKGSTVNNFDNQSEYEYRNYIAPLTNEEYKSIYKTNKPTLNQYKEQKYVEEAHGVAYQFVWNKTERAEDLTALGTKLEEEKRTKSTEYFGLEGNEKVNEKSAEEVAKLFAENRVNASKIVNNVYNALKSVGVSFQTSTIAIADLITKNKWGELYGMLEIAKSQPGVTVTDKRALEELQSQVKDQDIIGHNSNLLAEDVARQYVRGNNGAIAKWWNDSPMSEYKSNVASDDVALYSIESLVDKANNKQTTQSDVRFLNYLKSQNFVSVTNGKYVFNSDRFTNALESDYMNKFRSGSDEDMTTWYNNSPEARQSKTTFWVSPTNEKSYAGNTMKHVVDFAKENPSAFRNTDGSELTAEDLKMLNKISYEADDGTVKYAGVKYNIFYETGRDNGMATLVLSPQANQIGNVELTTKRFSVKTTGDGVQQQLHDAMVGSIANSHEKTLMIAANDLLRFEQDRKSNPSAKLQSSLSDVQRNSLINSGIIVAEMTFPNLNARTIQAATTNKAAEITPNLKIYKQQSKSNPNVYDFIMYENGVPKMNPFTGQYLFGSVRDIKAALGYMIELDALEGHNKTTSSPELPSY